MGVFISSSSVYAEAPVANAKDKEENDDDFDAKAFRKFLVFIYEYS